MWLLCDINMALAIFSGIVIIVTAGLIFLVIKMAKTRTTRLVLISVIVILALVIQIAGVFVWGMVELGKGLQKTGAGIQTEIEKKKSEAELEMKKIQPKVKETGEFKDIFKKGETISGRGVEFTVSDFKIIEESEFGRNESYCAVTFSLKNITEKDLTVYNFELKLKDKDGTILNGSFLAKENENKLPSRTDLSSQKEISNKYIPFKCNKDNGPFTLIYEGNRTMDLKNIYLLDEKERQLKPIQVELSL
jgi:hypothetical protein